MFFKLFLTIIVFFSFNAFSFEKYLYVIGGGGEPKGEKTIFDTDLNNMSPFANKSKWKTVVSFNGGHAETEKILKENYNKSYNAGDFVESNFKKIITDLDTKISNGTIKNGDQLMIVLNTHGAQNNNKETTHKVAFAKNAAKDLNNLSGADLLSIDDLKPILKKASDKGIKLAFIDQSCHSGNSLKLNLPNACIISATGAKHYGYSGTFGFLGFSMAFTFSGKFNKLLKEGSNLEDIFLKARLNGDSPDFPMISTEEGMDVQNLLYELITPYLYYNNDNSSKFDDMYSVAKIDEQICKSKINFKNLAFIIDEVKNMKETSLKSKDFEKLIESLKEYRKYQLNYEAAYVNLKDVSNNIMKKLKKNYPNDAYLFIEKDGISIINADYEQSIKYYQKIYDESKDQQTKKNWQSVISSLKIKKEIAYKLYKSLNKEELDKINSFKKLYSESSVTFDLASNVSSNMKKLYDDLYKLDKKTNTNPCRSFTL